MVIYGFFIYFQMFFKYKQLSKKFYTQMLKNYAVYNKMMQCQKVLSSLQDKAWAQHRNCVMIYITVYRQDI